MKVTKSFTRQVRKLFISHEETSCGVFHDLKSSCIFQVVLQEIPLQTNVYICCNGLTKSNVQDRFFFSFSEIISIKDS